MKNILQFLLILPLVANYFADAVFANSARTQTLQAVSALHSDITAGHINPASFGGGFGLAGTYWIPKQDERVISNAISLLPAKSLLAIGGSFDYTDLGNNFTFSTYRQTTAFRNRTGTFRFGVNVNYHQSDIQLEKDSYFSFDTGVAIGSEDFTVGVVLSNLFNTLSEESRTDPFGRVGLSTRVFKMPGGGMYLLADLGFTRKDRENKWERLFTGTEFIYQRFLVLRAGIRYDNLAEIAPENTAKIEEFTFYTVGGGLRLGPLHLDYGYKKFREFDDEHIVSTQLKFDSLPRLRSRRSSPPIRGRRQTPRARSKPEPSEEETVQTKEETVQKPVETSPPKLAETPQKPVKPARTIPDQKQIRENYQKHLQEATLAFGRKDYPTAIQHWKTALLWDVSDERIVRGQVSNAYDKWLSEAFDTLEEEQTVEKQKKAWKRMLEGYQLYLKHDNTAILVLSESVQLDETLVEGYKWLGCAYARAGMTQEARQAFQQAQSFHADLILIGDVPDEAQDLLGN
jgi:tetratricopeptide (TPR) repeat protein